MVNYSNLIYWNSSLLLKYLGLAKWVAKATDRPSQPFFLEWFSCGPLVVDQSHYAYEWKRVAMYNWKENFADFSMADCCIWEFYFFAGLFLLVLVIWCISILLCSYYSGSYRFGVIDAVQHHFCGIEQYLLVALFMQILKWTGRF